MSPLQRSTGRNVRSGAAVVLILVGSVAGWAATTEIAGAIIASGTLAVEGNVRKVQHPTGGVVGEALARDGDRVRAGDALVRLGATHQGELGNRRQRPR